MILIPQYPPSLSNAAARAAQDAVRGFAHDAMGGLSCRAVDVKSGSTSDAKFYLSTSMKRFTLDARPANFQIVR